MNEVALKGLLKMVKTIVSPEQIKEAANSLINSAIDFKNGVPLTENETAVTGIIYEVNNIVYCGMAVLNEENQITRFVNIQPFDKVVENLIKKM